MTASAQPDVTPSRIGLDSQNSSDDFAYYGASGGIRGFAIGSTACNIGNQTAQWIQDHSGSNAGKHPVIAQNVYRYMNGRFEHIGMSWLKHSFCAVSEPTCGSCQSTGCGTLGIGCADTYWATLNGDPTEVGPRSQINPWPAVGQPTHTAAPPSPSGSSIIAGRLQIHDTDIVGGARYFAEIHYMNGDEPFANRYNNASWREINLTLTSMSGVAVGQPSVHRGDPAILAWQALDPTVVRRDIDVPADGRVHLLYKVTNLGNGTWSYEYAMQNLNSARAVGSFSIPVPGGVTISSTGFHDVDYHSGEPYVGDDWAVSVTVGNLSWACAPYSSNVNANALRWSTLYNFRFVANTAPVDANATIGLFTPGTPSSVVVLTAVPSAPAVTCTKGDLNGDNLADGRDITRFTQIITTGGVGTAVEMCAGDLDQSSPGIINLADVDDFVSCILAGGC